MPTSNGSRYLQQLCNHWRFNSTIEFTKDDGKVVFPRDIRGADWPDDATLLLHANGDTLECRLEASVAEQLEALKGAVARSLDRYAFCEAPMTFDWCDG